MFLVAGLMAIGTPGAVVPPPPPPPRPPSNGEGLVRLSSVSSGPERLAARFDQLHAHLLERPDDEQALAEFVLLADRLGRQQAAADAWGRLLLASPPTVERLFGYARWMASVGHQPEALALLEAMRAKGLHTAGMSSLEGRLLAAKGDAAKARPLLERALEEEPGDDEARAALSGLH